MVVYPERSDIYSYGLNRYINVKSAQVMKIGYLYGNISGNIYSGKF